jgi:hypothetical protein
MQYAGHVMDSTERGVACALEESDERDDRHVHLNLTVEEFGITLAETMLR